MKGAVIDHWFAALDEKRESPTYAELNEARRRKEAAIFARLGISRPVAQTFTCECGEEFETRSGLVGHQAYCTTSRVLRNPNITHGLSATYSWHGCRCEACKEAYRAYQREYQRDRYRSKKAKEAGETHYEGTCRVCGKVKRIEVGRRVCKVCRNRAQKAHPITAEEAERL